jgi:glucose/arabinose dehydrogenase
MMLIRQLLIPLLLLLSPLSLAGPRVPPGFVIEVFAEIPNARQMALGTHTLFVGSMRAGKVYAVALDGPRAGTSRVIAEDLDLPVGVAFKDGDLYVSAVNRILRLRNIERHLDRPPAVEVVTDQYPAETHHGWKFIAFGPDGMLYVPVGAPCNSCAPDPARYAVITRLNVTSGKIETVARGVRNTVGFDWHPRTGELWFTENGRDWLGDNAPPDELNRLSRTGEHFGYPYCHGGRILDPEFGTARQCSEFTAPAHNLQAHVAPLGMRFYTGTQFPAEYHNAIFVAEHGSWNRSRKVGYQVMVAKLQGNRVISYAPFIDGWLQLQRSTGRPADVLVLRDGSLLVSDDAEGKIYRIRYRSTR